MLFVIDFLTGYKLHQSTFQIVFKIGQLVESGWFWIKETVEVLWGNITTVGLDHAGTDKVDVLSKTAVFRYLCNFVVCKQISGSLVHLLDLIWFLVS